MENFFKLEDIQFVFNMFRSAFEGVEWFVLAYIFFIVVFFVIGHQTLNLVFVYPLIFMAVTIFNPFLIVPLGELIGLTARMRRLFWLLPVNIVLAYVFSWICTAPARRSFFTNPPKPTTPQMHFNRKRRCIAAVCFVGFILLSGSMAKTYQTLPQNIYKTGDWIIQISDLIETDSAANGLNKKLLYSNEKLLELRQYNPSLLGMLRRSDMEEWNPGELSEKEIKKIIRTQHQPHILTLVSRFGIRIDEQAFRDSMTLCKIDYIIQETEMELGDYFAAAGYELLDVIHDFEIYHRVSAD